MAFQFNFYTGGEGPAARPPWPGSPWAPSGASEPPPRPQPPPPPPSLEVAKAIAASTPKPRPPPPKPPQPGAAQRPQTPRGTVASMLPPPPKAPAPGLPQKDQKLAPPPLARGVQKQRPLGAALAEAGQGTRAGPQAADAAAARRGGGGAASGSGQQAAPRTQAAARPREQQGQQQTGAGAAASGAAAHRQRQAAGAREAQHAAAAAYAAGRQRRQKRRRRGEPRPYTVSSGGRGSPGPRHEASQCTARRSPSRRRGRKVILKPGPRAKRGRTADEDDAFTWALRYGYIDDSL